MKTNQSVSRDLPQKEAMANQVQEQSESVLEYIGQIQ